MRPVDPGPWPMTLAGDNVVYDEYKRAKPNLTRRLGDYCSYCGMKVTNNLAVEHIVSKDDAPQLERDWGNFLLACTSCNSTKGTKIKSEADLDRYLWPHRDRTFDAFDYRAGYVKVARLDDPELQEKAKQTEALVGLSRRLGHGLKPAQYAKDTDSRWRHRRDCWRVASRAREQLSNAAPEARAALIVTIQGSAMGHGFWSVWMTVFAEDLDVQEALRAAFAGTAKYERIYPLPRHLGPSAARP